MRLRRLLTPLTCLTLVGCANHAKDPAPNRAPSTPVSASPAPQVPQWQLDDLVPGLTPVGTTVAMPRSTRPGTDRITLTAPGVVTTGQHWRSQNVGLSFESSDLADPRWKPDGSPLTPLLLGLNGPSLRFGGNSVDRRVFWTSKQEKPPAWAKATITPAHLQRLARMAERTDAHVTLVLDLGHKDPARAADMAAHAHKALGRRLLAVTIGNEPNGYRHPSQPQLQLRGAGWSPQAYAAEARTYATAITRAAPTMPIAGPGAYDKQWWQAFLDAKLPRTAALTQHWYPLWSCPDRKGSKDPATSPTVANLTSPNTHVRAADMFTLAAETAAAHRLPLWLEEAGPISCNGSPASGSHAHALWSVDFLLNAASHGVRRTNLHSTLLPCGHGNPMSPVCTPGKLGATAPLTGKAAFTPLLFAAQLRPGAVRVLPTGDASVMGYAISSRRGTDVVLVNLRDPARHGAAPLRITAPKGMRLVGSSALTGTNLAARDATTLTRLAPPPAGGITSLAPGSAVLLRYEASS